MLNVNFGISFVLFSSSSFTKPAVIPQRFLRHISCSYSIIVASRPGRRESSGSDNFQKCLNGALFNPVVFSLFATAGWSTQSCKSGRAFRVGPGFGLKFVKIFGADFGPAYKIYLETGHLIENFVNDWYLTTICWNCQNLGDSLKCWYF